MWTQLCIQHLLAVVSNGSSMTQRSNKAYIKQLPFLQLPDLDFEWSHHAEVGYTADFSKHPCFLHLIKGEMPIPWPLLLLTVYIPYLSIDA
jgi:hypothetical protein